MLQCSAQAFVRFFHNHGLLKLRDRPVWRTAVLAQNGSLSYSIRKWIDPAANSPVFM
jgi:predicted NAD/FAD-binding protein